MKHAITVDFGSTFTKIVVVDLSEKEILLSDKVPSSVGTDASIGLQQCFELARTVISKEEFDTATKLASSSAAGGLRMSVIGLTKSLSTLGGKSAALGAGAKIICNYCGPMTERDIHELENSQTEIVLLCGGYERGNTSMVISNANMLAHSKVNVPIIYSGNSELGKDIRKIMRSHQKQCFTVDNIIPELGELNVEPAQHVIRDLFLDRITEMKGLSSVKNKIDNELVPTPVAVLSAGELLNRGTYKTEGFGPVLIVDIGGATTDIYSFNENKSYEGAKLVGLEEPFSKRTVEGDLGMRESSNGVISDTFIDDVVKELKIPEEQLRESIKNRMNNIDYLPISPLEICIDDAIARLAVNVATRRHAGSVTHSYSRKCQNIQSGKNLSDITKIIGTGGILVHNHDPVSILRSAEKNTGDKLKLVPETFEAYLDTEYVLFAAGLLREIDEDAAIEIMMKSIKSVS